MELIDKTALVAEIEKELNTTKKYSTEYVNGKKYALNKILSFLDTLEVIDPYEQCVQYDSIKAGIQAQAETYSFNIESELFNQLTTEEQQILWRKEIEQAYISGGEAGVELARDPRYKENIEVKEVDLEKEYDNYTKHILACDVQFKPFTHLHNCAKYFFELGLRAKENKL